MPRAGTELFLAFHTLFPKRALVVMSMVDYKIQKRLEALVSSDVAESVRGAGSASNASVDESVASVQQVQALAGLNLDVGDRVCIPDKELFGFVRFLGEIMGVKGVWVGIELDEAYGKNDGSVKGRYYFRCKPKHGVFARPTRFSLPCRALSCMSTNFSNNNRFKTAWATVSIKRPLLVQQSSETKRTGVFSRL